MHRTFLVRGLRTIATALAIVIPAAQAADEPAPERTDYLTFAQGAVPVSIGGDGAKLGANEVVCK